MGSGSEVEVGDPDWMSLGDCLWSHKDWTELGKLREPRLTERGNDFPRVTPFKQAKASNPKFGKEFAI